MVAKTRAFADSTPGEAPVRGHLHQAGNAEDFLVLTHGAGGNANAPLLVALAERFAVNGISVLRCDLPYRQRKPHGPPSPSDAKQDQAGLRRAVELMKKEFQGRAFLGGTSYGGRQASMLVASDAALVEGLLLLSYPLHPPGRPAQLRTAHFPNLRVPALFVSGTSDAFAEPKELQDALPLIPASTQLVTIPGAAHSLMNKANASELPQTILQSFQRFFWPQTPPHAGNHSQ